MSNLSYYICNPNSAYEAVWELGKCCNLVVIKSNPLIGDGEEKKKSWVLAHHSILLLSPSYIEKFPSIIVVKMLERDLEGRGLRALLHWCWSDCSARGTPRRHSGASGWHFLECPVQLWGDRGNIFFQSLTDSPMTKANDIRRRLKKIGQWECIFLQ